MAQVVGANRKRAEDNKWPTRPHGVEGGADFDERLISGRKAFRYISELPDGANNGWSHSLNYVLASGEQLYAVTISVQPGDLPLVIANTDALERAIKTAPLRASQPEGPLTVLEVIKTLTANGRNLVLALLGAVVALGVQAVLRYRAKHRTRPQR